ncbi:MAG: hypothetical protein HYY38_00730, partial [Rhodospirillales bacterium]|nr:hypothetical protein [Rhodospirillales bacterium]
GVRKATGGELIFLNTYRIEPASDGPGVDDAVHALNAALSTVYGRFVTDLAKR